MSALKTFSNVTMYTRGALGNIVRTDCRELYVQEGYHYAQYPNALKVRYMQKGKRTERAFCMAYNPFLVIVPTRDAFNPPGIWKEPRTLENGLEISDAKYSCTSGGWEAEFRAKMDRYSPVILADYSGWDTRKRPGGIVSISILEESAS